MTDPVENVRVRGNGREDDALHLSEGQGLVVPLRPTPPSRPRGALRLSSLGRGLAIRLVGGGGGGRRLGNGPGLLASRRQQEVFFSERAKGRSRESIKRGNGPWVSPGTARRPGRRRPRRHSLCAGRSPPREESLRWLQHSGTPRPTRPTRPRSSPAASTSSSTPERPRTCTAASLRPPAAAAARRASCLTDEAPLSSLCPSNAFPPRLWASRSRCWETPNREENFQNNTLLSVLNVFQSRKRHFSSKVQAKISATCTHGEENRA